MYKVRRFCQKLKSIYSFFYAQSVPGHPFHQASVRHEAVFVHFVKAKVNKVISKVVGGLRQEPIQNVISERGARVELATGWLQTVLDVWNGICTHRHVGVLGKAGICVSYLHSKEHTIKENLLQYRESQTRA